MDDDFRDEGREFQHVGPETAKARKPNKESKKMRMRTIKPTNRTKWC